MFTTNVLNLNTNLPSLRVATSWLSVKLDFSLGPLVIFARRI